MKKIFVKMLSFLLCSMMLFSMTPITIFAEGETDMYITDLKVNNLVEPLGIDTTPTFRWINHMSGYAKSQSAYQIIVASTAEKAAAHNGDIWDSGKVVSNHNYDVAYGGNALTSRTEYFFAVQVWDEKDNSVWSDVSKFETGILNDAEWTAKWIGMTDGDSVPCDITLNGANWIWFKNGASSSVAGTEYFRAHFTVDESKEVDEVLLAASMDDYGYLFVNCANVLTVRNVANAWKNGNVVNITSFVKKGDNIFGARVVNTGSSAGFVAKIEVRYTDGSVDTTVTDKTWKCSNTATSTSGWENMGFDDTKWSNPDQSVAYGNSPWYSNVAMPATMQVNVGAGAPMLRKTFDVSKEVEDARLYISGLGLYELFVNGNLPDDTVLNPAHTQYEDTVHYRAYDVTEMLATGKNALAVELGNYYYNCDFYTWMNWNTAVYRDNPKLLLELHIDYADGTSETVVSNESWKTYEYGPVTYNNVYMGEHYDARREVDGWNTADFNDSAWKNAVSVAAPTGDLIFENMEPLRRIETFKPEVFNKGNGTYIIKNPVMTTGWVKIKFNAEAGTEITITYAEKLDEMGFVVPTINGYPLQVDKFITSGTDDIYEPKYSYKGYEYIQIDNYSGELAADDVECYLIANDITDTSEFETGDSRINYMHEMMLRTVMNNLQSKLTDTPVYEKNGWTGDVNFAVESFNYNYDLSNMLPKILRDMGDTTNSKGVVNQIAPSASNGGTSIPIWSSIFISGYYENYRTNGVFSAIEENYDLIRLQTLDYINTIKANGWVWTTGSYADWVSPNPSGAYTTGKTTHAPEGAGIIGSAFVYRTLGQMAEIADKLGKTQDAAEYRAAMSNIYTAFNAKFYLADKGYYDTGYWNSTYDAGRTKYRQASNIVPLMFGLCPEEYEESVVKSIVNDIKAKDNHLDVGAVGTKYILPMLSKYGYSDLAMTLVQQDTYPSWGYWINLGANTCWETYESNARSRNHFFLGTYTDWFYKNLAGVRDYANGFETVVLNPEIHPEIGYVNYSLKTVRGDLVSYWRFTEDNKLVWDVTIPVGTTATVYVPTETAPRTLGSGSYSFTVDASAFDMDKSLLSDAVADAKTFNAADYAEQSWAVLCNILTECDAVLADENATQFEVCAAIDKLEEAVKQLSENEARKALVELVQSGESLRENNFSSSVFNEFAEILAYAKGILSNNDTQSYVEAYTALKTAMDSMLAHGFGNLALNRNVAASSTVTSDYWGTSKLTDGNRENLRGSEVCGWTSNSFTVVDHSEYACVDLGAVYKVNQVQIMPAGAAKGTTSVMFPRDFTITVSTDGETWTNVLSESNYPAPIIEMQVFDFETVKARYVRFEGTSLRTKPTDGNRFRMQLAELEVYNTEAGDTTVKIGTAEEFMALMNGTASLSGDYKLTKDIDLTGLAQTPIGNASTPFTGTFDGDGHTISGINITATANDAGLFGVAYGIAQDPAVIKNLTISGQINGSSYSNVGGLVGRTTGYLEISNVANECVVSAAKYAGGIVGYIHANSASTHVSVTKATNIGAISSAGDAAGGIIGMVEIGTDGANAAVSVSECENRAKIAAKVHSGGIVGYLVTRPTVCMATVTGCLNSGSSTTTDKYAGGIVGSGTAIAGTDTITISNCMNTGDIHANVGLVGGILGGLLKGKDYVVKNLYTKGAVTDSVSAQQYYVGPAVGIWRSAVGDGNIFYYNDKENVYADNNTTYSTEVTSETVLVKDTFAGLLKDEAWIYVNGIGPELKAFHEHTEIIIPAVEPTYTSVGLTEGKKCSGCDEILVAQDEIPKLILAGDMDGNGMVTVADALVLIKEVVNKTSIENGDVNGDGKVGLADAIRIMKLAIGNA